ncbi:hypothetical protein [Cryptosporangium phraense]|uniref:Uncharacterized protein n=1 Tax=Cryptosporangium phraense TaxID=2593070 RepID=A0A545B0B6_9ACTN|nr:hypothetical protein [Cryptosporangium phraense]TQS47030.1 hypothetical protein FL583_01860 [Cryptosporangium phraense]
MSYDEFHFPARPSFFDRAEPPVPVEAELVPAAPARPAVYHAQSTRLDRPRPAPPMPAPAPARPARAYPAPARPVAARPASAWPQPASARPVEAADAPTAAWRPVGGEPTYVPVPVVVPILVMPVSIRVSVEFRWF